MCGSSRRKEISRLIEKEISSVCQLICASTEVPPGHHPLEEQRSVIRFPFTAISVPFNPFPIRTHMADQGLRLLDVFIPLHLVIITYDGPLALKLALLCSDPPQETSSFTLFARLNSNWKVSTICEFEMRRNLLPFRRTTKGG